MEHYVSIQYEQCLLRPLERDDIDRLRITRNQQREFFIDSSEITKEMQVRWYEKYINTPGDYVFVIDVNGFVGSASIYNFDEITQSCEFGRIVIDPLRKGNGIGTIATALLCSYAFVAFSLKYVKLEVLTTNASAIKVYKRIGFKETQVDEGSGLLFMELEADELRKRYTDVYTSVEAQIPC